MGAAQQQQNSKNRKNSQKSRNSGLQDFARYSGLAFQMIAIILISTWIGTRLDKFFDLNTPVFTIVLALLGVFGGIYTAVRDFIK